jgi:hypothetical protein
MSTGPEEYSMGARIAMHEDMRAAVATTETARNLDLGATALETMIALADPAMIQAIKYVVYLGRDDAVDDGTFLDELKDAAAEIRNQEIRQRAIATGLAEHASLIAQHDLPS